MLERIVCLMAVVMMFALGSTEELVAKRVK